MKKLITCILCFAFLLTACSKKGEYSLRPAKQSEIGMQAICPVTSNVFIVSKETMAVDYKSKTYFLCCPDCSEDFKKKLGVMVSHEPKSGTADMHKMEMDKPHDMKDMKSKGNMSSGSKEKDIAYYTCSMHPEVKQKGPGQCPICHMDLVPVYKQVGNKITVNQQTAKLLGLKSEKAKIMQVNKTVRLPARVAYDNDLYIAQQEYILSFGNKNTQAELLDAAKFRLKLLGYSDNDVLELEKQTQPDKSLLYPGDKVWLFADVYENDLQAVMPGKEVTATTDTYPSEKFNGNVMFIEPALNPETRAAKARITVNNKKNLLKLEMFANIEIKSSGDKLLAVPKTAVIDTGVRKVVYKDYKNGEYEPVDVKIGFTGDDYIEIKEGLKSGDMVVTNGNFMLDSESQLKK